MFFKISKQDVKANPSLKGECGKWGFVLSGAFFIRKSKKQIVKLYKEVTK